MAYNLKDQALKLTLALPNGAANTTTISSIDTGKSTPQGVQTADVEYLITAPALTTSQLPDTKTITYDVIQSDNADLSAPVTLYPGVLVQTGAGGAGAAATSKRVKLPSDARRYIGLKATNSGAGNASTVSATLEVVA